jgi:hypothetical protein
MGVVQPSPKGIASASFTESVGLGASKPIAFWRQKKQECMVAGSAPQRIKITGVFV